MPLKASIYRRGTLTTLVVLLIFITFASFHQETLRQHFDTAIRRHWIDGRCQDEESCRHSRYDAYQEPFLDRLFVEQEVVKEIPEMIVKKVPEKMIILGHTLEQNVSWVTEELADWPSTIYTVNDPSASLHTPHNKGREANVYLRYIIDNYDNLPDIMIFLHWHKDGYPVAWHNDNEAYSNVETIRTLRLEYIQQVGYANLRCNTALGCPAEIDLSHSSIAASNSSGGEEIDRAAESVIPQIWTRFFGVDRPIPEIIASPCCAQFGVTADVVRRNPRKMYVDMWNWLMETDLDDDRSGRVLEYLWHIIFGQESVYCRDMNVCYCEMYGRC